MPSYDSAQLIVKFSATYASSNKLPYDERIEEHPEQYLGQNWINLAGRFPGLKIERIFTSLTSEQLIDIVKDAKFQSAQHHRSYPFPENHFLTYFRVRVPPGINHEEVIEALRAWEHIERADKEEQVSMPSGAKPGTTSEDILTNQRYLGPPPEGINAICAWKILGADGGNDVGLDLRFADVEQGWNLTHPDLPSGIEFLGGSIAVEHINHGTLVLGIVLAVPNNIENSCVGITPNVSRTMVKSCAPGGEGDVANAIIAVTPADNTKLHPGDVLLLEAQRLTALPLEEYGPLREAIYTTTQRNISVVEPAGNAGVDLDSNPSIIARDTPHESGAIMVGAASRSVPHTRLISSNYGSRIDCYAWGEFVYSTLGTGGYGTLGETSAAAAIIAGAALSIQGIAQHLKKGDLPNHRFSPSMLRSILRSFGTPSQNPASDKIGLMPDLRQIILHEFDIDCRKPVRPPGVMVEGPLFVDFR